MGHGVAKAIDGKTSRAGIVTHRTDGNRERNPDELIVVSGRLTFSQRGELERRAKARGMSMAGLIESILSSYLEKAEDVPPSNALEGLRVDPEVIEHLLTCPFIKEAIRDRSNSKCRGKCCGGCSSKAEVERSPFVALDAIRPDEGN